MRHYYTNTPFGIYITPARVVDAVMDVVKESVNEERKECICPNCYYRFTPSAEVQTELEKTTEALK